MLPKERQEQLLEVLKEQRYATVQELSKKIFVSTATVRRDLKLLEAAGLVHCTYGGVAITQPQGKNVPLPLRRAEHVTVKQQIARAAAALISPHETLMIDGSSTAMHLCDYLSADMDLTVFTYCVDTAARLAQKNITAYCLGGQYNLHSSILTGYFAEKNFESVTADWVFFSAQGLSLESGHILDSSADETRLRQIMLRQAKRSAFLCDSSKFGRSYPFILASLEDVDVFISDEETDSRFQVKKLLAGK
ncbi:MAG: DeoR/GlpR transcriptional regulator [Clostridiales bacterium]|nr:DeoR/GlpR transcriptional regulator [Clostridiales bacterium]